MRYILHFLVHLSLYFPWCTLVIWVSILILNFRILRHLGPSGSKWFCFRFHVVVMLVVVSVPFRVLYSFVSRVLQCPLCTNECVLCDHTMYVLMWHMSIMADANVWSFYGWTVHITVRLDIIYCFTLLHRSSRPVSVRFVHFHFWFSFNRSSDIPSDVAP